jgi:hypothetical protein
VDQAQPCSPTLAGHAAARVPHWRRRPTSSASIGITAVIPIDPLIPIEPSRGLFLTFVGVSIALTLIGSGAGIVSRCDRSLLARGLALVGWLVGLYLLFRIGHLWGLV